MFNVATRSRTSQLTKMLASARPHRGSGGIRGAARDADRRELTCASRAAITWVSVPMKGTARALSPSAAVRGGDRRIFRRLRRLDIASPEHPCRRRWKVAVGGRSKPDDGHDDHMMADYGGWVAVHEPRHSWAGWRKNCGCP